MLTKEHKVVIVASGVCEDRAIRRVKKLTEENCEKFLSQAEDYSTIQEIIPEDCQERFDWAKSFNQYLNNQRSSKKYVATSNLSGADRDIAIAHNIDNKKRVATSGLSGADLNVANTHNMENNHYVATSGLSGADLNVANTHNMENNHYVATSGLSGADLNVAMAHNMENNHYAALGNLSGDQRVLGFQHNVDNGFYRSKEAEIRALTRIDPDTLEPLGFSTLDECKEIYRKGHGERVLQKYNKATTLFPMSRDHTVGAVGAEPGDAGHFYTYGSMTISTTLPRISAYSNMKRHAKPALNESRILMVLDMSKDTALICHGEGVFIELNNRLVDVATLDAETLQKGSSINGVKSVFKNFRDPKTGEVHSRVLPPHRSILYLMVVVNNDVLRKITHENRLSLINTMCIYTSILYI